MYCGKDFAPGAPGESITHTFDFARDLAEGELIATASWTCAAVSGSDPSAADRIDGPAAVDGTKSLQRISGLVAGVIYVLEATVVTTAGNTVKLHARKACRAAA